MRLVEPWSLLGGHLARVNNSFLYHGGTFAGSPVPHATGLPVSQNSSSPGAAPMSCAWSTNGVGRFAPLSAALATYTLPAEKLWATMLSRPGAAARPMKAASAGGSASDTLAKQGEERM